MWVGFGEINALVLLFHTVLVVEEVGGEEQPDIHDMQMTRLWLAKSNVRHSNNTNSYRETQSKGEREGDREREKERERENLVGQTENCRDV